MKIQMNDNKDWICSPIEVGRRLKKWRKSQSMKLADVSKLINTSQGTLSDLENGKSLPSAKTLAELCKHSNLDIIWLLINHGEMIKIKRDYLLESDSEDGNNSVSGDATLKSLVERLERVYFQAEPSKLAHIKGFLAGADPKSS